MLRAAEGRRGQGGDDDPLGEGRDGERTPAATNPDSGRSGYGAGDADELGKARAVLSRLLRFVGRTLHRELNGMVVDPVQQLVRRGPSALLLAFVAVCGVVFFHAIAQHSAGAEAVRLIGGVQGDLPLPVALLRTPVSLYVPALDLPVWAGITQLFLAFALAEVVLGRARTLAVAYATTLMGTLTVRVMLALGPGRWGLGLPPEVGRVLDTGPSAAVVGLFTYLSVVRRAPVVFILTGGSMVWESIARPNLAGREHLIAVGGAIVLGLLHGRGRRRRHALTARLRSWPARRNRPDDTASSAPEPVASPRDRVPAQRSAPRSTAPNSSGAARPQWRKDRRRGPGDR